MKKNYIAPSIQATKIMPSQRMLTISVPIGDNYNGTSEIESREFDYDDEE